ncbi:MAG: flagellar type III secretion system pore protein FliP [Gemmatimonadales bacterium]
MPDGLMGLVGATAITVGLLLLALRLLHRLDRSGAGRGRSRIPLSVIQRLPLGAKQSVSLVRVGRRVLVVGQSERGPALLTELKGEDRLTALGDAPAETAVPARRDPELKRLLSRLTLGLALTLATATVASAQARPDTGRRVPISPPASVAPARVPPTTRLPGNLQVKPPEVPAIDLKIGQGNEQLRLSGTVGLVVFLGALTLLPAVVLLMTGFTRILVVLHFLRSALGTQGSPPGQLLIAIAILLTGVVMHPVLDEANRTAVQPYFDGQIDQAEAYRRGVVPFRQFMLANVREKDLASFTEMTGLADVQSEDDIPTLTIVSAFVTSELQTAFWMGFVIYIPFVVVDLIVATSLMSLGMFMVPPVMISLPFKLLLFVLADGWSLIGQNLVSSFQR